MIHHTLKFYKHMDLQEDPSIKSIFYHFDTLPALVQYETLFKDIDSFQFKLDQKILDWGCGNGWFSYYLISQGFRDVTSYAYGWDSIKPAMDRIPQLKVVNGAEHQLSTASKLPFPDQSFDVVFSIGVLEHVHETGGDQIDSLNEIKRILGPGGIFYCYHFPNKYTWIEYLKSKVASGKDYLHTKKFTREDIVKMSNATGMEILKVQRYNLLPYNIFRNSVLNHSAIALAYRAIDTVVSLTPLNHFAQDYLFVAKKTG